MAKADTSTETQHLFRPAGSKGGAMAALVMAGILTAALFLAIPLSQLLETLDPSEKPMEEDVYNEPPPPPPPPPPAPPPPEEEEPDDPPEFQEEESTAVKIDLANVSLDGGIGGIEIDTGLDSLGGAEGADDLTDFFDADDLDEPPEPTARIEPDYPAALLRRGAGGIVQVQMIVDENGRVVDAKVLTTSNKSFDSAAINAARKWTFKPGIKGGKRVKVRVVAPFSFKVNKKN